VKAAALTSRLTLLGTEQAQMARPEDKNYAAILRLEQLLETLRANPSTARETEAIREIGLEIAVAIREVGAMLVNVAWEQTFATNQRSTSEDPDVEQ
jgi:hypothetical protein